MVGHYNLSGVVWHPNKDIFYDRRIATRLYVIYKGTILGDAMI